MSLSAHNYQDRIIDFLRDIIRIPSFSGKEEQVVKRIAAEMKECGVYDDVRFDPFGLDRSAIRRIIPGYGKFQTVSIPKSFYFLNRSFTKRSCS